MLSSSFCASVLLTDNKGRLLNINTIHISHLLKFFRTEHIAKKDAGMSILPRSFAKSRFFKFKNSHKINTF